LDDELTDLQTKVERAESMVSALEVKLAGVAPSERSLTDLRDHERLLAELTRYRKKIDSLNPGGVLGDGDFRFVNRQHELEQVSRPTCPQYLAIEAPAGFGKSILLERLQKTINIRSNGAVCLYATIKNKDDAEPNRIDFIGPDSSVVCSGLLNANQILLDIVEVATQPGQNEIVILFDNMENVASSADDLDHLWRNLVMGAERRLAGIVGFRVVFCGRRVISPWQGAMRHRLQYMTLEPFNIRSVAEAIQQYATSEQKRRLTYERLSIIAREVLVVSGGHPRAIISLVREFARIGFALDLDSSSPTYAFSHIESTRMVRSYVLPCLDEVFKGIENSISDAMQSLSVFRGFNGNIVSNLINKGLLTWKGSPMELLASLSKDTWLVSRPSQPTLLYRDSIVRSLSASVMRTLHSRRYSELTHFAYRLFLTWVTGEPADDTIEPAQATDHLQTVFALETLYHFVDLTRIGQVPATETLLVDLVTLTKRLTIAFICTYGDPDEMRSLFFESLQKDLEFWEILGEIAGNDVVDEYSRAVTEESL
jgi:hypothetical protein